MSIRREDAEKLTRLLGQAGLLGQLAVLNGFVTEGDLARCVEERRNTPNPCPLREMLLSKNLLTPAQLRDLESQLNAIEEQDRGAAPSPAAAARARKIGHYSLIEILGEGGGGTVWKAWDGKLGRWVALKESRGQQPAARERFIREARTAAKLNHPNLVEVYEVTVDSGRDFIVMEYIDGRPLDELRPGVREAAALLAEIADAVDYMHGSGVIHRDLKPQNVIVDGKGIGHLGDFGIAKAVSSPPLTLEGSPLGTPQYMAPEQVDGRSEALGPWTDVYGLGATLYHCLSGCPPYPAGESFEGILGSIRSADPRPLRSIAANVPPDLDVIVRRAMARAPAERYSSAAAFRDDLRRFLRGESILARPDGLFRKAGRWTRRNGRLALAAALAALASACVVGFYTVRRHAALRDRQDAYEAAVERADRLWQKATGLLRAGRPSAEALRGALEQAAAQYEDALSANRERPYPWLMKGRCLLLSGRRPEAEAAWTESLRVKSDYGPALFERGKSALGTYVRLGLRRGPARSSEPPDPESDQEKGWRLKGERDLAAARDAKDLEKPSVGFLEGMLELGRGRYDRAVEPLALYVAESPWDSDALTYLGAAHYQLGRFEEARASWSRALELEPNSARHTLLGSAFYCLRQFSDAVDQYSRALKLDPQNSGARCNRGLARLALGESAAAIKDFNAALAQSPRFARAFNGRGIAWFEKGDIDRAHADFERAAECSEFYAEAHNNLGNTHVRRHEIDQGITEYGVAIELRPDYAEAHFNRAIARLLKGDLDPAIADFRRASELDPRDPETLYQLALAERAKGDADQALRDISRALELPSTEWAKRPQAEGTLREWAKK